MSRLTTPNSLNATSRWAIPSVLILALALLGGCGGDSPGEGASAPTVSQTASGPGATVTLGADRHEFTGGRCFVAEDGGSDGAVSVSEFTSEEGAELSVDWAGDSPGSSMVHIDLADGTQLEASTIGASSDSFEVSVTGRSANVRTTVRALMGADNTPRPVVIEVRCR